MIADLDAMANEPIDAVDGEVLAAIARTVQVVDPMPDGLTDRIRFELTLAALHAEVAELQELSAAPAGVRADTYEIADTISFTGTRVSLMVSIAIGSPDAGTVRIDGWIMTPGTTVELWQDGDRYPAVADGDGRLVWEEVPRRPTRFLILGGPPVVTPRIEL